jgi:transcriptional regulator with XRE-family HTH domain
MKSIRPEAVMRKAQKAFEISGKTLEELGTAMGYQKGVARRAAWQFLNKTSDPRLSMLQRFAEALDIELRDLL